MFFKKRKTDIDDDFDDDDAFDDFDLDDAGFDDTTPKTGLRAAVSTVTGGFFSGLKSEVLNPTVHRKILKESLPDGYVAHYDDAKDALREAKSIYNTAAEEARILKKEYAKEARPAVDAWNKKSNSKLSNAVSRAIGENPDSDTGGPMMSEGEMAFTNSANDIFGMTMAQQTSDGIQHLNERTQEATTISQGLQGQTNEILTNMSNSLGQQNAFNEQIALKLSKKKLEIQFKQYFTARKQLEIQTQTHDYLEATLPNIVKNTSLPDIVKTQTSELASQMLSEKWIGTISGKAHESISEVMGKAGVNLSSLIKEKTQGVTGQAGMLGSALSMFDNESGFGQGPLEMLQEAGGGFAASQLIDFIVSKSTDTLKLSAEASGTDFEKGSEGAKQLKLQLPAIIASLTRNGTGVDALDKLLELSGLDRLADGRSTVIQSSMGGDKLASQAIFNLETQKSITYTIPALLSEIHGELRSVRFSVGGDDPDPDNKLRMDWTSGRLNTSKRIGVNLEEKMYTKIKADEASEVVYKMLGKLGFNEEEIRKEKQVLDKDGNVLLATRDLNYLTAAVKTASYDATKFFDIEELANGSSLIRDPEARMNVASFFTKQLEIEGGPDTMNGTIDIVTAKRNYFANRTALKIKQQNIIDEARIEAGGQGVGDDVIKNAVREGNITDLINQGIVTVDKNGNYTFDAQAHAERLMFAEKEKIRTPEDLFGFKTNNKYGSEDRNRERILREEEQAERERVKKAAEDAEKEAKKAAEDAEVGTKASKAWRKAKGAGAEAKAAAKKAKDQANAVIRGDTSIILPDDISGTTDTDDVTPGTSDTKPTDINELIRSRRKGVSEQSKKNYQGFSRIQKEAQAQKQRDEEAALNAGKEASVIILGHVKDTVDSFVAGLTSGTTEVRRKIHPKAREPEEESPPSPGKLVRIPTRTPTVPNEDGRYVVNSKPLNPRPNKRNEDGLSPSEASEMVFAAMTTFNRMYGGLAPLTGFIPQKTSPFTNLPKNKSNFFTGGTVGKFSSLIKNFALGGTVDFSDKYNKILDKLLPNRGNVPQLDGDKSTEVNDVLGPIKNAIDRETAAGGDPQVIVASTDEEILSNDNGDAQAFRDFKKSGVWAKLKTHKELYVDYARTGKDLEDTSVKSLAKALITEVRKVGSEKTEGLRGDFKKARAEWNNDNGEVMSGIGMDEQSVKFQIKNVAGEVKKKGLEVKDKLYDPEAMEGIGPMSNVSKIATGIDKVKGLDTEENRAAMMGKLLGIKDFSTDKLKSLSGMFNQEEGGKGIKMPSFSLSGKGKAISTISHQIGELIRITGHVAINTGSTADDLVPPNPELIAPYSASKGISFNKDGGFFKSMKERFKRNDKMEGIGGDEDTSRWGRLKNKFKRKPDNELDEIMSNEEIDESTPEGKKKGLIRRMLGGMFGLSWGATKMATKASWWVTKKSAVASWWATKKAGTATAWGAKGLFGSTGESQDVYLEGNDKPVMLARDMAEGKYISAEDGKPVLTAADVKGAILDLKGNFIITAEDYNSRRVIVHTNEGTQSLFVRAVKGTASLSSTIMGGGLKASWAIIKMPFNVLSHKFNNDLKVDDLSSNGKIDKDIYVKGDAELPIIRAKLIGKGEYWTHDRKSVETYDQIKDGVYDKTGNLILGPAELKKGLYTPDGNVLTKGLDAAGSLISGVASTAYKVSSAAFSFGGKILKGAGSLLGKLVGGGFSLATGAGKGLWNSLKGGAKDFDIDGVDKYALLLQAQAAGVDKLEMIRVILDERMENKNGKYNDKDGDGERDGSYMSQLRKKLAAKKEKDDEKGRKKKEKMEGTGAALEKKSMLAGLADSVTSGISGFFSKGLMFAALGGLVAANFGPQIATGIFSGIRSVLPRWLGGYSQEKKDEIAANGGIIKHMMSTGAAAAEDSDGNTVSSQPQVDENGNPLPPQLDENGNPVPTEEGTGGSGLSTSTKFMLGAGAMMAGPALIKGAVKGIGKGIIKTPGLLAKGTRLASNKIGLTSKLGLSGMGKKAALKHIVTKSGSGLKIGAKALVNAVGSSAGRTAAINAGRTLLTSTLPALAATPLGLGVLAAVAVGVAVYAGYKLYKHLTKEDNHLATFRMAQYGYKIGDKDIVTKILDLEQYLGKYTAKASASTSAKISTQASTKEVLKIFGVSENNKEDVDKFMEWYYYRFKPVYLSWKTLFARSSGRVTIEDVDKLLLMEDKIKMVGDADFARVELNPYDTMTSPMPGVAELELTHEDVIDIKTKVLTSLGKIDVEKHDNKVRGLGGGSKSDGSNGATVENMTASPETPAESKDRRMKEEKKKEAETKAERTRIEKAVRAKEGADQSFIQKLLSGDKSKDPSGPYSWGVSAGKKLRSAIGNFFGGGDGGEGGTYDASSKTLNLSEQDIKDITKVTSTEAAEHLGQAEYNRQAGAIVDTIINRVISKGYPDTVRGVINQKSQFSAISGNKGAYGSIQNMPDSAVKPKANAFVPGYLRGRVEGTVKPVINGDLNYLNPAHSGQKAMRTWGKIIKQQAEKSGQIYGTGDSMHYHGTSTEMLNKKPFGFKLATGGKTSPAQGTNRQGASKSVPTPKAAEVTNAMNGTRSKSATKSTPSVVPGTGPMAPTKGAGGAPAINVNMKSVTGKPGAGSTATGPSTWQKIKNFNSDLNNALSGSPSSAPVTMKDGSKKNWTAAQKKADSASAEPKAAKADGNFVAPQMTKAARPAKAVAYAMKKARPGSTGRCAAYVREALRVAGYTGMNPGNGCPSAYMYATTGHLARNGFKEIPATSRPQLGDVGVTSAPAGKIHGHIAIFNGSKWVSDFVHNQANPYSDKSLKGWLFRDAQFLDGAPAYDGESGEGSGSVGAVPYRMDTQAAIDKIKVRREKRQEIEAKSALKKYKSNEVNMEFSGGLGRKEIKDSKPESDGGHYDMKGVRKIFGLPKSDIISYDNTPTGYIPKERVGKTAVIEDNGAIGNTIKTKRDAETIRLEHAKGEAGRLTAATNAQRAREENEKQNQAQLKRVEKTRSAEVASATEQKVVQEKRQKIAETDSGIYKQQLEVQISMAKDMRRMAETLDKMYALPQGVASSLDTTPKVEDKPAPVAEMNTHTKTVATDEPVSMKIR